MTDLISAIVLAAGRGSRMCSDLPKPLHKVGGLAMVSHVLNTVATLNPDRTSVVVSGDDEVAQHVAAYSSDVITVVQPVPLGTGDALRCAVNGLWDEDGTTMVLCGDVPLIKSETIKSLLKSHQNQKNAVTILGFDAKDPGTYGRLMMNADGSLKAIVEAADAHAEELEVTFCNSGILAIDSAKMSELLKNLDSDNAGQEFYLTDIVGIAHGMGLRVGAVACDEEEVLGANDRAGLAHLERIYQTRRRLEVMQNGVTLMSPETVTFCWDTVLEPDVTIEPNVFFGPGTTIQSGATIRAFSHIEGAKVANDAVVGPFARLRPGAYVGCKAKVGNFVEIKKSAIGPGAKISHLSYIGDTVVGTDANIGAGTITCNYDGFNKYRTVIGNDAFIGSNTALVAPVTIGSGAIIGAGSTVTDDVDDHDLVIARAQQTVREKGAARLRVRRTNRGKAA